MAEDGGLNRGKDWCAAHQATIEAIGRMNITRQEKANFFSKNAKSSY